MRRLGIFLIVLQCLFITSESLANVLGSDSQNFNTTTSGLDFVTVHSSETLKPGLINLGLFFNYAVNTLPYFDHTPQGRTHYNDSLLGMDMNIGVGLGSDWDVGLSAPFVLAQDVSSNNSYRGQFASVGNTEIRINTKYRFFGDDSRGLAAIASVNFNRIIDNPYSGGDAGPIYNLEVAGDTTVNKVALGLNLGYRWRSPGRRVANSPIQPLKDQIIGSIAASYLLSSSDTKIITEIFSGFPAEPNNEDLDRTLTTAEWIIGVKHDVSTQLAFHLGGGTELLHGVSTPDWRVYSGLNYSFGPVWPQNAKPALEPVAGDEGRFRTRAIYFGFDSDEMVGSYSEVLEELVKFLQQSAYKQLIVEGHTDSVGAAIYNLDLSQRRAQSIRSYLISHFNVPAAQVTSIGYGETRPIADNGNYQGRQLNRRVEFKIER